jgi:PPIC-type PPIASE domain
MSILNAKNDDGAGAPKPITLKGFWNFRTVNPARSLVFLSIGTLIGLGIAGYGLFTAKGTVTHTVPPENVALVNQRPILRTDFIAQAEALYNMPFAETTLEQRMKVLQDMIREELFVQRGLELDFPSNDPDTRAGLVAAVEMQVAANVTAARPSEADLRKFYEENPEKYASEGLMTLHDLLLPKAKAAAPDALVMMRKAADELRSGVPFATVMKTYGLEEAGGGRGRGAPPGNEEFYFAQKIHIGEQIFSVALALNDGQVCDPVVADDGIHIVQMVRNVRPVPATFERARGQVLQDFNEAGKKRLEIADERYLRGKAEILVAEDYLAPYQREAAVWESDPEKAAARGGGEVQKKPPAAPAESKR